MLLSFSGSVFLSLLHSMVMCRGRPVCVLCGSGTLCVSLVDNSRSQTREDRVTPAHKMSSIDFMRNHLGPIDPPPPRCRQESDGKREKLKSDTQIIHN